MQTPLTALIIEEDDIDRINLIRLLENADDYVDMVCVANFQDAIALLKQGNIDVVLFSHYDSIEKSHEFLHNMATYHAPIPSIIIFEHENTQQAYSVLNQGAADCLYKSQLSTSALLRSLFFSLNRQQSNALLSKALQQQQHENLLLSTRNRDLEQQHEQLKDQQTLLEYLVDKRTVQYKSSQQEAEEKALLAENANKIKSEFLATMSHEIRTPMNGVIGMLGLMVDTPLSKQQQEYTDTALHSAESLLAIINDILDFSKVEAGKLELELMNFDLKQLLSQISDLLRFKADDKQINFHHQLDTHIDPFLIGDATRLRQVLINLADNAIKFTSQGKVVIDVALIAEKADNIELTFKVIDTGIGINKQSLDSLFEAFQQVDASTTRQFGGTGLGLSIAQRLVELMGSKIQVSSTKGEGTTFSFTLTLPRQDIHSLQRSGQDLDLQGKSVLIVDDNLTNRHIYEMQLEGSNCEVQEAVDAMQALTLMRELAEHKKHYDIAIIDMDMPEIDGIALGQMIKAEAMLKKTHLILASSSSRIGDSRRAKDVGFDIYINKPVKKHELFNCISSLYAHKLPQKHENHKEAAKAKNNLHILIVEDNLVNQKVASKMLEKLGFETSCVNNGQEAVDIIKEQFFHLILMDCQMPVMGGFEATEKIRHWQKMECISPVTIIAMTANSMQGDKERCIDAGMDAYLSKPVVYKELDDTLKFWCEEERLKPRFINPNHPSPYNHQPQQH